jgi:hypothetical protein
VVAAYSESCPGGTAGNSPLFAQDAHNEIHARGAGVWSNSMVGSSGSYSLRGVADPHVEGNWRKRWRDSHAPFVRTDRQPET